MIKKGLLTQIFGGTIK